MNNNRTHKSFALLGGGVLAVETMPYNGGNLVE